MTNLVYVKSDKVLCCGCNPGYWTQGSVVPFRHKHIRVAVMADSQVVSGAETEPAPKNARVLGGTASRWWSFLGRHHLVAFPRGLSKRERRLLGA